MELLTKLKKVKRKKVHITFVQRMIAELHSEIFHDALEGIINTNKAKLIRKYNRRLQLILF
jgi:hypothetical protein